MSYTLHSFDVTDRPSIRQFVKVPWSIYRNDPHWVPPLIKERLGLLSPAHPYFEHAKVRFWTAYQGSRAIGRISAQFDEIKCARDNENIGYFGMFECIDDQQLANQLLSQAEQWLGQFGCEVIRGPFNLSINQESGLLVEGFDTPPYIMMGHAMPYYQILLENHQYRKAKDLYAWFNQSGFTEPPAMRRLVERYQSRITLRDVDKNNFDRDIRIMMRIFNDAWSSNWGFIPFTENEFVHLGKEMLQLIPASHFKIAQLDGEPVGMIAGLPNFNEITKDLDGKLFPTGIFKLLWRLKFSPPRTGRVALLGIRQAYQNQLIGSALAFLLINRIKQVAHDTGVTEHEMSWVLEDNERLNKILESLGGERYKTYRVYEKKAEINQRCRGMRQWDAVILAGDRGGNDPVAMAANVEGKAYATLGDKTLLERVASELRQSARIKNIFAVGPGVESLNRHQDIQASLEKLQVQLISPAAGPSASALKGLTTSSFYPALLVTCDLALLNTLSIEAYCDTVINLQADFVATAIDYQKIHQIIPSLRKTRYRFNQSSWCFANVFAVLSPDGLKAIEYWQHLEQSRKKPIQLIRKIDWWSLINYKLGRLSLEQVALTLSQKVGAHLQIVNMNIPELAIDVDSAHDYQVVKSYLDAH